MPRCLVARIPNDVSANLINSPMAKVCLHDLMNGQWRKRLCDNGTYRKTAARINILRIS